MTRNSGTEKSSLKSILINLICGVYFMYESEVIVYVEKNGKRKFNCDVASIYLLKKLLMTEEVKIIYFETFKSSRGAKLRLKKMQSLNRFKLGELIKGSNPEMLNLINCI